MRPHFRCKEQFLIPPRAAELLRLHGYGRARTRRSRPCFPARGRYDLPALRQQRLYKRALFIQHAASGVILQKVSVVAQGAEEGGIERRLERAVTDVYIRIRGEGTGLCPAVGVSVRTVYVLNPQDFVF